MRWGFGLAGSGADELVRLRRGAVSRVGLADGDVLAGGHRGLPARAAGRAFGFLHIFTNMFSLYILGTLLEPAVGGCASALIYLVSLLAGSFGALLLTPTGRPWAPRARSSG